MLLWLSIFSRLMIVRAGLNATLWQRRPRGTGRAAPGQRSVPLTPVG